jgi:hypothetical protein
MNHAKKSFAPLALAIWLFSGSLLSCGCNSRDTDRLAAFGTKLGQKMEGLLAPGSGRTIRAWHAIPVNLGDGAIDARVSARLNGDKALAEASIQVQVVGGTAELHGKVRSEDQRRRAYELAQTTLGVEKVLDRLEIGP